MNVKLHVCGYMEKKNENLKVPWYVGRTCGTQTTFYATNIS